MLHFWKAFLRADSGASAAEYGLVVMLITLVIIGALGLTGNSYVRIFNYIGGTITNTLGSV